MFNLFKKRSKIVALSKFTFIDQDIHSHILPGLDDGAANIESSIELVKGLYALGIKRFIATPHVIGDMYRNNEETIKNALALLRDAVKKEGLDVTINAAAEYMLDDYFLTLIKDKTKLLTVYENYILTEFSYAIAPRNIDEIAFNIFNAGYFPILAHPERYAYFHGKKYKDYYHLKDLGFLFQVNLLSLTGYYGIHVEKAARYLLNNDMVDHVGTDIHHVRHLESLKNNLGIIHEKIIAKKYNMF